MSCPNVESLFAPYIQNKDVLSRVATATVMDMQVSRADRFLRIRRVHQTKRQYL